MAKFFYDDILRINDEECRHMTGKLFYSHNDIHETGTAYQGDEAVSLFVRIPRAIGATEVTLVLTDENINEEIKRFECVWYDTLDELDVYKLRIPQFTLNVGLYFFHFEINSYKKLYGYKDGTKIGFTSKTDIPERFQLTISEFMYSPPCQTYGGIIYHIFVDRFNRGGEVTCKTDSILVKDWSSEIPEFPAYPGAFLRNNTFFGGTLYGITAKLDYLVDLGVNTIYLSPIFEAYSNHKYDTADYLKVDEMFGGDVAFAELICKAKERGIGIILDGVFNHTGADSVYFNKFSKYESTGAFQSKSSPYYNWYKFQKYPDKYTSWWGIDILPRIHHEVPECADFFVGENGVIDKYAKMGIAGFRLDVADELSDDFIHEIKDRLNESNTSSILYGEVWEDASNKIAYSTRKKYYLGNELDGVMNYPLRNGIIDYIKNKSMDLLSFALNEVMPNMPKRIRDATMNVLGTHDTERILTVLGGQESRGRSNTELSKMRMSDKEYAIARRRLKTAYTLIATLPGIPSIYYGDEAGMEGYSDPFNRRTYPWGEEDHELLSHYITIGKIRRNNSVYIDGQFKILKFTPQLLIFERIQGADRLITLVNNSTCELHVGFQSRATELITESSQKHFIINPETASIFKANSNNYIIL